MHRSAAGPSLTPGSVVRALKWYYAPLRLPLGGFRPAQEGLSSSVPGCPCIPRPLRRGVLGGCTSQVFPTSIGLRLSGPGSAPPCPLHAEAPNGAADFALCCGLQVCSPSLMRTLSAGIDAGLSASRRRPATRRLGPYRDRTLTGKPNTACLDTPHHRRPKLTHPGLVKSVQRGLWVPRIDPPASVSPGSRLHADFASSWVTPARRLTMGRTPCLVGGGVHVLTGFSPYHMMYTS